MKKTFIFVLLVLALSVGMIGPFVSFAYNNQAEGGEYGAVDFCLGAGMTFESTFYQNIGPGESYKEKNRLDEVIELSFDDIGTDSHVVDHYAYLGVRFNNPLLVNNTVEGADKYIENVYDDKLIINFDDSQYKMGFYMLNDSDEDISALLYGYDRYDSIISCEVINIPANNWQFGGLTYDNLTKVSVEYLDSNQNEKINGMLIQKLTELSEGPDLEVISVELDQEVFYAGGELTGQAVVKNVGTEDVTEPFILGIWPYLNFTNIGSSGEYDGGLAVGEEYIFYLNLNIPEDGIDDNGNSWLGNVYGMATVDGLNVIDEMVETNNVMYSTVSRIELEPEGDEADGGDEEVVPYPDVSTDFPYFRAIFFLKKLEVLDGYPDGTFRPENSVNRVEFLKMALQGSEAFQAADIDISDCTDFSDTDMNSWYGHYLCYAVQNNIVDGYPDGTFKPNRTINLVEALKILNNVYDLGAEELENGTYDWYYEFYQIALKNDLLPDELKDSYTHVMKRGEMAEMIMRFIKFILSQNNEDVQGEQVDYFDYDGKVFYVNGDRELWVVEENFGNSRMLFDYVGREDERDGVYNNYYPELDRMQLKGDYLFFISGKDLYRVNVDTEEVDLALNSMEGYELINYFPSSDGNRLMAKVLEDTGIEWHEHSLIDGIGHRIEFPDFEYSDMDAENPSISRNFIGWYPGNEEYLFVQIYHDDYINNEYSGEVQVLKGDFFSPGPLTNAGFDLFADQSPEGDGRDYNYYLISRGGYFSSDLRYLLFRESDDGDWKLYDLENDEIYDFVADPEWGFFTDPIWAPDSQSVALIVLLDDSNDYSVELYDLNGNKVFGYYGLDSAYYRGNRYNLDAFGFWNERSDLFTSTINNDAYLMYNLDSDEITYIPGVDTFTYQNVLPVFTKSEDMVYMIADQGDWESEEGAITDLIRIDIDDDAVNTVLEDIVDVEFY